MVQAAREGVDWWVMRIAAAEQFSDTYQDVAYCWSFYDQLHAHRMLDCVDDCRELSRPPEPNRGGR